MQVKRNDIVEVSFLDHAEGQKIIHFNVYGRISKITKKAIVVDCWTYKDKNYEPAKDDYNIASYAIVRSAITSIRKLERK